MMMMMMIIKVIMNVIHGCLFKTENYAGSSTRSKLVVACVVFRA
jgi:hypothetical protein